MGLLDRLAYRQLQQLGDGRAIFYPSGICGSGYLLTGESQQQRIRGFLKIYWIVTLVFLVLFLIITEDVTIGAFFFALVIFITLAFVIGLSYEIASRRILNSLHPAPQRLPFRDSFIRQAEAVTSVTLWSSIAAGLLLTACGIYCVIAPDPVVMPYGHLLGVVGLTLFGGATVLALCSMAVKMIKPHVPPLSGS